MALRLRPTSPSSARHLQKREDMMPSVMWSHNRPGSTVPGFSGSSGLRPGDSSAEIRSSRARRHTCRHQQSQELWLFPDCCLEDGLIETIRLSPGQGVRVPFAAFLTLRTKCEQHSCPGMHTCTCFAGLQIVLGHFMKHIKECHRTK